MIAKQSPAGIPVDETFGAAEETQPSPSLAGYRKRALAHYRRELDTPHFNVCVVCGFGIQAVLEVAHLGQDRTDNTIENLAVLCPNCHKMHDIGLIPSDVVRTLRDYKAEPNWKLRIKDAGAKAADSRRKTAAKKRSSAAGKKAWETRQRNGSISEPAA